MPPLVFCPVVLIQRVEQDTAVLADGEARAGVDSQAEGRLHEILFGTACSFLCTCRVVLLSCVGNGDVWLLVEIVWAGFV